MAGVQIRIWPPESHERAVDQGDDDQVDKHRGHGKPLAAVEVGVADVALQRMDGDHQKGGHPEHQRHQAVQILVLRCCISFLDGIL